MNAKTKTATHAVPAWLVRSCCWISHGRGLIWSSLFNIVLNLIATWLFTARDSDFSELPLTALLQHWYVLVGGFLLLELLIFVPARAIGSLPVEESPRKLRQRYLTRRILQTRDLAIEGIPLIPPRVQLDEVFIPVQLRPHQATIDQLLTPEQRKLERERIRRGEASLEVERVLIDLERQHELLLQKSKRIEIKDLWCNLTREQPAAVIQGYPGMGKSTLLLRLTLYMARYGLGESDPLNTLFEPALVPLFIRLGRYAAFRRETKKKLRQTEQEVRPADLSLWHYLQSAPEELDEMAEPDMWNWLRGCLERGQCLALFDGLDEVSDATERFEVQEAIKVFVTDVRAKATDAPGYNRFLITSRVAGYDQNAFPGYPHYTIAELTPEQIKEFLPRWCRASVRSTSAQSQQKMADEQETLDEHIARQAAKIEQKLNAAIQDHQGIREMVENPFLLTLLAVMQQNGIELPDRRVELYKTVTEVLLERRNALRNLPVVPVAQAVQRLGPVACQMQATKNSFTTRRDVLASFAATIEQIDRMPPEQAQAEARVFLERVRQRAGIFVQRTGDYFGFFHRTFQEYFAARYLLRRLETESGALDDFLQKARQRDDLWREPALLAVAYKTSEEASLAWQILKQLLKTPSDADWRQRAHDVLLVGDCLVEARTATIPYDLERAVICELAQLYTEARQREEFKVCGQIEEIVQFLLRDVSQEAEHSALLLALREMLLDSAQPERLRAVLIMLTLIAQDLHACVPLVFQKIVPPLLGLAGLPATGTFQPEVPATAPDLAMLDLALAALSFLGARGPAGEALKQTRPRFEQLLKQLARCSLESGLPLTPAVMPLEEENYRRYEEAVRQWRQLYDEVQKRRRITEQDLDRCAANHQSLLQAAEEVCYPAQDHLLRLLELSQDAADWQATQSAWQGYLREQMNGGTYLAYQFCALLWITLFDEQAAQQELAALLHGHLSNVDKFAYYANIFW